MCFLKGRLTVCAFISSYWIEVEVTRRLIKARALLLSPGIPIVPLVIRSAVNIPIGALLSLLVYVICLYICYMPLYMLYAFIYVICLYICYMPFYIYVICLYICLYIYALICNYI
eukprot:GHVR01073518.1.p1 GENE.GHVR01073518.1~~GHVR01073518.1.p1  ORF type:complete len:115 (-),score=1.48 GHVR01073518.1:89-433(-)